MGKILLATLLTICLAMPALAGSDKIDPETYICAELVAENTTGEPPLFEGLQLDGYAARRSGQTVADSEIMQPMLIKISDLCQAAPTDKVLEHWRKLRQELAPAEEGIWRADRTTCGDYYKDEENGSGFLIWVDGWHRAETGNGDSILRDQATFDKFLAACRKAPDKLVVDVIGEVLKQ